MNKMGAIALRYAEFGWPVIPVHTPTGDPARPCSCRRVNCPGIGQHPCHKNTCKNKGKHPCHQSVCNSVGKHPRTNNGVHDASTDEAKIHHWWETWNSANIAIALGKVAGFFALDVDPRNGGDETLAALGRKHGRLPKTRTAETGGGGTHLLFKYPDFPVKKYCEMLRGNRMQLDRDE
jgi:Bifunctional DNA primase/polymerase, N-terminal